MTIWRVRVEDGAGQLHAASLSAEAESNVSTLGPALEDAGFSSGEIWVDGQRLNDSTSIGDSPLQHGSVLSANSSTARGTLRESLPAGYYLIALTGWASGFAHVLTPGRSLVVGRSAESAEFFVPDSSLSGIHFTLTLETDGLTIQDNDSTNGTYVEGERVGESALGVGDTIRAGDAIFTVIQLNDEERAKTVEPTETGLKIARKFRRVRPEAPASLTVPTSPSDDGNPSAQQWWRYLLPLATSAGIVILTGRWIYLAIVAIAPIAYLANFLVESRRRKAKLLEDEAAYAVSTEAFWKRVAHQQRAEVQERRSESLGNGLSSAFALFGHERLWERSPDDEDFAALSVGYAMQSSRTSVEEGRESTNAKVGPVPLQHRLIAGGPLAVIGAPGTTAGVLRSLVLDLAATHSPNELCLWIVTDERFCDDWDFARWLPHTAGRGSASRVAVTESATSALLTELRAELRSRQDRQSPGPVIPAHILIVNDRHGVQSDLLAVLMREGPRHGISGIVADPSAESEGMRATLSIGEHLDLAAFESTSTSRIDDVSISFSSVETALKAAISLAPLQAFSDEGEATIDRGSVFLSEQIGATFDADFLVERWGRMSPTSEATVGRAAAHDFRLDVMGDGPHGLIGGTTRSGKTEFLKAMITSLAMNNHPDDLCFALIDFKGGADHELSSELPHVIGLATNQDISGFTRYVRMLEAELDRRQQLVKPNLDVYRQSRAGDPSLPPIPRLVVLVDEFSELLESDEGRAQLGRLASITRVGAGFGVHLILVTQNFENQLPPQIAANAGMRICFRVQEASHSKIVLDSAAAASISVETVGRAYARLQGRPAVEFQGARIANRRRDLAADSDSARLTVVPIAQVTSPPASVSDGDVEPKFTDMFALIEAAQEAARITGWTAPAIPWPDELPPSLSLTEAGTHQSGALSIAWADEPDQLAIRRIGMFQGTIGALVGSADQNLASYAATIAVSQAISSAPDELHIYGIDMDGRGLAPLQPLPHVGAVALRDNRLGLRILDWIRAEVDRRRSVLAKAGLGTFDEYQSKAGTASLPRILLLVAGVDRISASGEERSPLFAPLLTLLRECEGVGLQVVLTGSPSILHSRMAEGISERFIFSVHDANDLAGLQVPAELRAQLGQAGRAIRVGSPSRIVQFADLKFDGATPAEVIDDLSVMMPRPAKARPETFWEMPYPSRLSDLPSDFTPPAGLPHPVLVALDKASGRAEWFEATEDGPLLQILGGPKSGRSNALLALGLLNSQRGWNRVAIPASSRSPLSLHAGAFDAIWSISEIPERLESLESTGRVMFLVDDAHRLSDVRCLEPLLGRDGPTLVAVTGTEQISRIGGASMTNRMVLAPTQQGDIGRGFDAQNLLVQPRAGVGVLVVAGEFGVIQMPHVTE